MKNRLASVMLVIVLISAGLIMLTGAGASAATAPEEMWNKTFGGTVDDSAYSVQQTSDGGYIVAGSTHSFSAGSDDAWLIKTDSSGKEEWNKTFGGLYWDGANSVQRTSDGGYMVAGTTYSFVAVEGSDAWLIKTDSSGNEEWNKTYGGSDWDRASSVQQTSDGGYIIAGDTKSFGAGSTDAWLIKTDSSGNEEWSETFGGSDWDGASSVQQTSGGGYIVAGFTVSFGAGELDYGDAWLIKTDSSGNEEWAKTFGRSDSEIAVSVQQTLDGGYIVAGETASYYGGFGSGSDDAWLIKTDSKGNKEWDKTFGGVDCDGANSVQQTSDGGYIVAGYSESLGAYEYGDHDVWLIKTDSLGSAEWDKTFGCSDYNVVDSAFSVQQTSDGGYILAGNTQSYGAGGADAWLVKVGGKGVGTIRPGDGVSEVTAPDIEKPPEKSIPGFGTLEAMVSICILAFLGRKRS